VPLAIALTRYARFFLVSVLVVRIPGSVEASVLRVDASAETDHKFGVVSGIGV